MMYDIYHIITCLIHLQKSFLRTFFSSRTHNESLVHRLTTTTKYDIKYDTLIFFKIKKNNGH